MGDAALRKGYGAFAALREYGYFAEYDLMGRGLKAQMKYANKIGAAFTIVLGDNELERAKLSSRKWKRARKSDIYLGEKFAASFEEVYFNKMLDFMDEETGGNGSLFAFTGEDK